VAPERYRFGEEAEVRQRFTERPVHLVIISGLAPEPLREGLADGYLEALGFLSQAGTLRSDCVAPFPSVTPTCLATITTGLPPRLHGILGRAWYERRRSHVHEFDPRRELTAPSAPILASRLMSAGKRTATSNVPIGCGGTGPGVGESDLNAADLTRSAIQKGGVDLTITFLRDHDVSGHGVGPGYTMPALWRADRALGHLMEAYGTWEDAVWGARWLVMGDHGMSRIRFDRPHGLGTHEIDPSELECARRGVIAIGNGRSAFVYLPDGWTRHGVSKLVDEIVSIQGVDQVCWEADGWTFVRHGDLEFAFAPGQAVRDHYGRRWRVAGNPAVLGLTVVSNVVADSEYPDPMCRFLDLLGADASPDLVVTARDGFEFSRGRPERGSHGSLTRSDSLVPLLAVGMGSLPIHLRSQSIADIVASALDVPAPATS
jgi:hypothetical protein